MKKYLLLILLLLMVPLYVNAADHNYLYDVLKNETTNGTLAKEYTGNHNDTIGGDDKKVYHWYSTSSDNKTSIENKWNVIFGGKCWEMFRTTDGGGTKLIYNGTAQNNKCLDDRPITGEYYYFSENSSTFGQSYYYGTSYRYSETDNLFYIDGDITKIDYTDENDESMYGKYTCQKETATEGCSRIGWVIRKNGITSYSSYGSAPYLAYIYIEKNPTSTGWGYKPYSIGNLSFTENVDLDNTIGYMYDTLVTYTKKSFDFKQYEAEQTALTSSQYVIVNNDANNMYQFNEQNELYTTISGTYTSSQIEFKVSESGTFLLNYHMNSDSATIKVYINGSIIKDSNYIDAKYDSNILLSNLSSTDVIKVIYNSGSSHNTTFRFNLGKVSGEVTDNRYLFGKSFTYENGKYKLTDTDRFDGSESLGERHYSCLNTSDECEEVYYVRGYRTDTDNKLEFSYVILKDGMSIDDYYYYTNFHKEDVNKKDSIMKIVIDRWFENNMLDYQKYMEPTSYCNKRTFLTPTGYKLYDYSRDKMTENYDTELYCDRETDRFSTNNPKAKLKYPVALITAGEVNITSTRTNNSFLMKKSGDYNTMTPYTTKYVYMVEVSTSDLTYRYGKDQLLTRPVISLKANTEILSGTGNKEDPYMIADYMYSAITKENDEEKGSLNVVGDMEDIRNNTEVTFTVENKEGFNIKSVKVLDDTNNEIELTITGNTYKFNMPTSNVRIITEYTAVLNILNTLKNMNTALIAIILVIIGYATYILIKNRKKSK